MNWFKIYLKHRQQLVSLGKNENSIFRRITCVVLQGSILGPLLFLIYINDLFRGSSKLTQLYLQMTQVYFWFQYKKSFWNNERRAKKSLNSTSFSWIFPKQNILYFIPQDKEKIYEISYLHCTTFQSKENSSQSFSECT